MNTIDRINRINQQELDNNVEDSASWHMDYKDTLYIYIGNLSSKLKPKDVIIIFSQFGIPTHLKFIQDKGFGYLKYEKFGSCVLAVDNLNGVVVYDRNIKVDHCWFRLRDNENEDDFKIDYEQLVPQVKKIKREGEEEEETSKRKKTKSIEDKKDSEINDEFKDPMESFGIDDEFKDPLEDIKNNDDRHKHRHRSGSDRHRSHRSHHHHHHRSHGKSKENNVDQ